MGTKNGDKVIVALDVDSLDAAKALASELAPYVGAFKVGLELINNVGAPQIVSELQIDGSRLFFDSKLKDIPNTVAGAARAITRLGVWMFNVHAMGGLRMMEAAMESAEQTTKSSNIKRPLVIAVTILTSMDAEALTQIGLNIRNAAELKEEVVRLALLAKSAGLDGVVASPQEIKEIREACGANFKIITPGVRPMWSLAGDQKRVTTPAEAIKAGADYIVIGRPITRPPGQIGTPLEAVKKILGEI